MRGQDEKQDAMFSYVAPEQRVPADHSVRKIRALVDAVLAEMSPELSRLYADTGRPSIAPERLLRALLLQVFYSIRSERLLMEQLDYNLLFRGSWDEHGRSSVGRDGVHQEPLGRSGSTTSPSRPCMRRLDPPQMSSAGSKPGLLRSHGVDAGREREIGILKRLRYVQI
jgi:hypothetical protein